MYLYRPYINNPIQDGHPIGDMMLYPNLQNREAKRYSMFSAIVAEKIYNYWDRIGDLIATYFPDLIKPSAADFARAIDIIPKSYQENANNQWLKNFKENQYKELNTKRRQYVHYKTADTQFKHEHLMKSTDIVEMEKLVFDRNDLADYYKEQHKLTLLGFEKTMLLIEAITEKTLNDI